MIIIPARIDSSRFPRKVLAPIDGIPMVVRTAMQVKELDSVAIATDSPEVVALAKEYDFEAVLTSANHKSGTDRINEAAAKLGLRDEEVIVNVQGDEPFIEKEVVAQVLELTRRHRHDSEIMLNSAYKKISAEQAKDPNLVKVILNAGEHAVYFSRSLLPYPRDGRYDEFKGHLGLYGYTKKSLERFCALPEAPLEDIEKLEQLRAIYHGYKVAMTGVATESFGIDTPEDLEKAKAYFSK